MPELAEAMIKSETPMTTPDEETLDRAARLAFAVHSNEIEGLPTPPEFLMDALAHVRGELTDADWEARLEARWPRVEV